jgi:hypothetical protein
MWRELLPSSLHVLEHYVGRLEDVFEFSNNSDASLRRLSTFILGVTQRICETAKYESVE